MMKVFSNYDRFIKIIKRDNKESRYLANKVLENIIV